MPNSERILLFRPDHFGDVLHTTPVLHAIRRAFPDAHLSILIGSWAAPLFKGNPDPDDIILCNLPWLDRGGHPTWRPLPSIIRKIRAQKFDRILNFRVAAKAAGFSRLLGGRERWGFDVKKSAWAWTHTVHLDRTRHVVDNYMALAKAIGVQDLTVQFRVFPESEDLAPVHDFLKDAPPTVVLGPTSGHPQKSWLSDRWATVGDHMAERGFRVLLNGGPSEGSQIDAVQSAMKHPAESLVGRFSVLQLAELLKQSAALITLDSFPMHLAAAVGTPIVALFGATDSKMWGPYPGPQPQRIVEPPPDVPRNAEVMHWIQVEHVIDAFDPLGITP